MLLRYLLLEGKIFVLKSMRGILQDPVKDVYSGTILLVACRA